jgi:site-specific recombinase XerD
MISKHKQLVNVLKGGTYSSTSIKKVVEKAALQEGIKKRITPHMLVLLPICYPFARNRHRFAAYSIIAVAQLHQNHRNLHACCNKFF